MDWKPFNFQKHEINSLNFTLTQALFRILKVSKAENITECRKMYSILSIEEQISFRKTAHKNKAQLQNAVIKYILSKNF